MTDIVKLKVFMRQLQFIEQLLKSPVALKQRIILADDQAKPGLQTQSRCLLGQAPGTERLEVS
ncbi:MAG: hypothetical protein LAT56_10180, partial [Wenzhouxiangella sp.]|nr:hypothetical protein [Wenzhouxiangella sp.]